MNTLRLQLRFLIPLLLALVMAAYLALPLMDRLTLRWFARDLNVRGSLVTQTLADSVSEGLQDTTDARLQSLFDRVVQDERLVGLGLCSLSGEMLRHSPRFPSSLTCEQAAQISAQSDAEIRIEGGPVHVGEHVVMGEGGPLANLVVLQDFSFVERRSEDTRQYLIILIAGLGAVMALITVVVAQLSWRGWVQGTR